MLSSQPENKWFLNSDNHIVEIITIYTYDQKEMLLRGNCIKHLENVFEIPIKSSLLSIFKCSLANITKHEEAIFKIEDIKAKLVAINYQSDIFFAPLLYTL
ncbi:unnamed protein product [Diatraea saccharalis]|uniref:Uncharacterized protein n=1 Tax=Diatraea saccharalis TaxID=40085 RepID=A0A9N9MZV7_9NEOP|nr:unnamed protein product [Diatraea saccharalis]